MIHNSIHAAHEARPMTGRNKGVTLIELAFVIGIIAVILVAVLGIFNVVKRTQTLTDVTSDVAVIRQAVSTWASGGPITHTAADTTKGFESLSSWSQLAGFLPGSLGQQARDKGPMDLLVAVNSWGCTYDLQIDTNDPDRYKWSLEIDKLPTDVLDTLATRLREGVIADEGEGSEAQQGLVITRGEEGDSTGTLKLTYRH